MPEPIRTQSGRAVFPNVALRFNASKLSSGAGRHNPTATSYLSFNGGLSSKLLKGINEKRPMLCIADTSLKL